MRYVVLFLSLLAFSATAAADNFAQVTGPARPDVMRYLSTTKTDACMDNVTLGRSVCSLSKVSDVRNMAYGKFPNDGNDYAVVFLATGIQGTNIVRDSVLIFRNAPGTAGYSFVGSADFKAINPRDVRFQAGRTITWTGTAWGPNDPHCCPTARKTLRLVVGERTLRLVDQ
jgi:hypothetical protein